MKRARVVTGIVLAAVIVAIVVALFLEAASGPTFRPEDYATYQECVRNIPVEWGPGSMQREGAEQACGFVHLRR